MPDFAFTHTFPDLEHPFLISPTGLLSLVSGLSHTQAELGALLHVPTAAWTTLHHCPHHSDW